LEDGESIMEATKDYGIRL